MSTTPLTLAELQKAQAEAEGFQNGPAPALNNANLYTQATAGNPQPTPPAATPVPYYPSSETPNLNLSTRDMASELANNFVILDNTVAAAPVVQAELQAINTTVVQTATITVAATTLYAVSIYMAALGTAVAGHTLTANITYTAANGLGVQTVALILPLSSANVVVETYPLLVLAGTPITLSTVYGGGAVNDPYTISARLVQMPL